tara:strand:- start:5366 stop:5905 length:540 start_codon:yes stop_codon:yes gene_type:complete
MSGPQLALMTLGAMMDKENRLRGAALGFGVGTAGTQLASSAAKAGTGNLLSFTGGNVSSLPMNPQNVLNSLVAKSSAGAGTSSGLLESLSNTNNPFGNQLMQSVLSPRQPNQQVVSGGGMKQGTSPQFFSAGNNTNVNSNDEQIDEDELFLRLLAKRRQGNPQGLISISGGNNQNAMVV